MKTAISIPDSLYKKADLVADKMGIPRSQLYAKAVEEFLLNHDDNKITEKLNMIYAKQETSEILDSTLDSLRKVTKNDSW
jgi:metal-responsive CopG/Arc/MetJ family transcriptional regulator